MFQLIMPKILKASEPDNDPQYSCSHKAAVRSTHAAETISDREGDKPEIRRRSDREWRRAIRLFVRYCSLASKIIV